MVMECHGTQLPLNGGTACGLQHICNAGHDLTKHHKVQLPPAEFPAIIPGLLIMFLGEECETRLTPCPSTATPLSKEGSQFLISSMVDIGGCSGSE